VQYGLCTMVRLLPVLALFVSSTALAQTVDGIAARGACSTAGVEGLSRQLAETQMCMNPGAFVRFAPHAGISLSSSRVHPYMQASARDALWAAAARTPLSINSAFRTLADQYVLYHSGGCGLAAQPGRSNHQSGRAVDVGNWSAARSALTSAGCSWFGSRDAVHFDCAGSDRRGDSIRAFQRLWNRNNPSDPIAEDGVYGPQTAARLGRSPAGGFASTGCEETCTPRCDGAGFIAADCSRTACAGGEVCVDAACEAPAPEPPPMSDPDAPASGTAIGVAFRDSGAGLGDTSQRISGVRVRIAETGDETTSDAGGVWRFPLAAGTYTVEAYAEGYAIAMRTCEVASSGLSWCSVGLERAALGTLRGVVYEERSGGSLSARVPGATVRLRETADETTASAGSGAWSFEVPAGTYTVEVSGAGMSSATRSCTVAADATTWCSVGVRPSGSGGGLETFEVDEPVPDDGSGMPPADAEPPVDAPPVPAPDMSDPSFDGFGGDGAITSGCAAGGRGPWSSSLLLALLLLRRRRV